MLRVLCVRFLKIDASFADHSNSLASVFSKVEVQLKEAEQRTMRQMDRERESMGEVSWDEDMSECGWAE